MRHGLLIRGLKGAARFNGAAEGDFIGKLKIATNRQAACKARDLDARGTKKARKVACRRFALDVGIGRDYDLFDGRVVEARQKLSHMKRIGADALKRRERPAQNMIFAGKGTGALYRRDIARLGNDADDVLCALIRGANLAQLVLGVVKALLAKMNLLLHLDDRIGQAQGIGRFGVQNPIRDALRGLGTDAGQTLKFIKKLLYGRC